MRHLVLGLLISLAPIACAHANEGFGKLTVQEVKARLHHKNVYLIDNNTPEQFKEAHVPSAKWLSPSDYDAADLPSDKSATLIFYCHNEH